MRITRLIALLLLAALLPEPGAAQPALESAVKATYLAKFPPYIDWPQPLPPGEPLHICMIGRDTLGRAVERAAQAEGATGRQLVVRRLPAIGPASGCHIAFLGGSGAQTIDAALRALQGAPVLTVTDARLGPGHGIIHFAVVGGRVRFAIDEALAARGSMMISSKLLGLASSVRQRERG